jgi:hypothetical protein
LRFTEETEGLEYTRTLTPSLSHPMGEGG